MLKVSKRRPESQPNREGNEEGQMISTMRKVRENEREKLACMQTCNPNPQAVRQQADWCGMGLNQSELRWQAGWLGTRRRIMLPTTGPVSQLSRRDDEALSVAGLVVV